jgi:hypothetical protein
MAGDDQLPIGCLAHPVDRPRLASPSGIPVAPRRLCHDGGILGRSANDRPIWIKRGYRSDINDEAGILLRALPDHLGTWLHTEQRTTLRAGNTRCSRSRTGSPFHIHSAWLRSRSTRIAFAAKLLRVCFLTSVATALRLRHGRRHQKDGNRQHSAPPCKVSVINQDAPRKIAFSKTRSVLPDPKPFNLRLNFKRRTNSHL